jgi:hypothetical protein
VRRNAIHEVATLAPTPTTMANMLPQGVSPPTEQKRRNCRIDHSPWADPATMDENGFREMVHRPRKETPSAGSVHVDNRPNCNRLARGKDIKEKLPV